MKGYVKKYYIKAIDFKLITIIILRAIFVRFNILDYS